MSNHLLHDHTKTHIQLIWIIVVISIALGTLIIFTTSAARRPIPAKPAVNRTSTTQTPRMVWTNSSYQISQPVNFTLINRTANKISLHNSSPWRIISSDGILVFTPVSLQVITELAPGESRTWAWDQKDNQGKQVPTGTYKVLFDKYGSATFTISDKTSARDVRR